MDRLVSTEWLEKELGAPDLRLLDCTVAFMNVWAARVWWMLHAFGFDEAAVLDGGWRAWVADGRPIATDPEPDWAPASFVARVRPGVFVGKDEVLAAMDRREVCLVDALPREVHRGERQD